MAKEAHPERVLVSMNKALIDRIDDWRFSNRITSRAEAIRRLIELSLGPAPSPKRSPPRRPPK